MSNVVQCRKAQRALSFAAGKLTLQKKEPFWGGHSATRQAGRTKYLGTKVGLSVKLHNLAKTKFESLQLV
jgi:hypothetical protein